MNNLENRKEKELRLSLFHRVLHITVGQVLHLIFHKTRCFTCLAFRGSRVRLTDITFIQQQQENTQTAYNSQMELNE